MDPGVGHRVLLSGSHSAGSVRTLQREKSQKEHAGQAGSTFPEENSFSVHLLRTLLHFLRLCVTRPFFDQRSVRLVLGHTGRLCSAFRLVTTTREKTCACSVQRDSVCHSVRALSSKQQITHPNRCHRTVRPHGLCGFARMSTQRDMVSQHNVSTKSHFDFQCMKVWAPAFLLLHIISSKLSQCHRQLCRRS